MAPLIFLPTASSILPSIQVWHHQDNPRLHLPKSKRAEIGTRAPSLRKTLEEPWKEPEIERLVFPIVFRDEA